MSTLFHIIARFARPSLRTIRTLQPRALSSFTYTTNHSDSEVVKTMLNFPDVVIPKFEKLENFPKQYICPEVSKDMIADARSPESRTDSLVAYLLYITEFNRWPLKIDQHVPQELNIVGLPSVAAIPAFQISKKKDRVTVVVLE
ncbi:18290_t:CDS:2, partial [Funneliformis geosporum]